MRDILKSSALVLTGLAAGYLLFGGAAPARSPSFGDTVTVTYPTGEAVSGANGANPSAVFRTTRLRPKPPDAGGLVWTFDTGGGGTGTPVKYVEVGDE